MSAGSGRKKAANYAYILLLRPSRVALAQTDFGIPKPMTASENVYKSPRCIGIFLNLLSIMISLNLMQRITLNYSIDVVRGFSYINSHVCRAPRS